MKRTALLVLVLLCGCSTAPLADLLDFVKPVRIGPGPYRGGVGAQHNGPAAPPLAEPAPPALPPPPGGPVP